MAEKKKEVEVVEGRSWTGGPYGSKAAGDRFAYDVENDPDQLIALGLVKEAAPAKAAASGGGKG
jgi:hypothetical protein